MTVQLDINRALRIGSRIGGSTSGSVLFVDSNLKLAEDNSNLFWNDSDNNLGLGTTSFGTSAAGVLALANGTQGAAAADMVQLVAKDWNGAGTSAFHIMTEEGTEHVFGSFVGINNTSPLRTLHIVGQSRVEVSSNAALPTDHSLDTGSSIMELINDDASAVYVGAYFQCRTAATSRGLIGLEHKGNNIGDFFFMLRDGSSSSKEVMRLTNGGNVGIGAVSPAELLEVEDGNATTGIQISNTAADGDPFLAFALSGTKTFTMGIDDGDGDKFKIGTSAIGTNTRFEIDSVGTVFTNQGRNVKTTRTTTTATLDATNYDVPCDTDGGAFTVTLEAGVAGTVHRISNTGTSANNLTIAPDGAELLIGVNSNFTLFDGESLDIIYEGTEGWN